jgi:7-cyano-7-deazaguanine tRNA-ribosyltransferase
MTDSGTFQSYVYGDLELDPIEIVEFQRDIGSDIGTILDIFGKPDITKKQAEEGMIETIKRAKKSIKVKKDMNLACTVQGSVYPDLRNKCAQKLSKINSDFFPIGGVVPLMENQKYSDLVRVIISSKKGLDPSKPVHLFGAGHPMIFPLAVALGCDFFDSSAYIKYAKDERMIFPWGTEKLEDINELSCNCPVCSKYKISEFKKLEKNDRTREIAKHNLYISFSEIRKIRNEIEKGSLWELVERRSHSNPHLLEAMNVLKRKDSKDWLEKNEPISKKSAVFYTGSETIHRPIIYRAHKRLLNNYCDKTKDTLVFAESEKPYSTSYRNEIKKILSKNPEVGLLVDSTLGPVPFELDEMYPFAQSVIPRLTDKSTEEIVSNIFNEFTCKNNLICWKGKKTIDLIKESAVKDYNFDIKRVNSVCDMQFGKGSGDALLEGKIKIVKSKKTKKIRNIYSNGKHILSMRAEDGMFTLKIEGAKIIHKKFKKPQLRVVIHNDAVPFVKEGKSVFSKFVEDCDDNLRPYDECLIVDSKDDLIAVGRCLLNKNEMLSFEYGMAVKTRENL